MRKAILLILTTLLLVSIVSAGITFPRPKNIQLTPGESSFFTFQIQQTGDHAIICKYEPENLQGLEINLESEYEVGAGERLNIKGTVKLPESAAPAEYEATFCIECSPKTTGGSTVKMRYCGLPVTVEAVSTRTRANQYDIEEKSLLWLILLIVLITLLIIIWFLLKKKRQTKIKT